MPRCHLHSPARTRCGLFHAPAQPPRQLNAMPNFTRFAKLSRQIHAAPLRQSHLIAQYRLLKAGVRGIDAHSPCLMAWIELTRPSSTRQ
jgi:hypothetical protein